MHAKPHHPPWFLFLIIVGLFSGGCPETLTPPTLDPDQITPPPPRITELRLPERFEAHPLSAKTLLFTVEGEGLDPRSDDLVDLRLRNAEREEVPARFSHFPSVLDVFYGHAEVGLEVGDSELAPGRYSVCASLPAIGAEAVCSTFLLTLAEINPCQKEFLELAVDPKFGCRCKSGKILLGAQEKKDFKSGKFTQKAGGDKFGAFKEGSIQKGSLTSLFKFEAHFEVEAVNDPGRPAACTEEEWQALISGFLCREGQELNKTHVAHAGKANELRFSPKLDKNAEGDKGRRPYKADSKDPKDFFQDGHGYLRPAKSGGDSVEGDLKAYDDPWIVHWLDAPGVNSKPMTEFANELPVYAEARFHAFVRGSSAKPEDTCDCYFNLRYGVVNADGTAGDSKVLQEPKCE